MIDSHCHLAAKDFRADLDAVLARARAAGIDRIVTIGDTMKESEDCMALAAKYEYIFCTIGVHPHAAKEWKQSDAVRLESMAASGTRVVGIGEIGLDYHYDHSPRDVQKTVFRTQLALAKKLSLPAVIHCREAVADIRSIVESVDYDRFVIHCCTERWDDISWVTKRGGMLSFTGIATYPKSDMIRETIRQCPADRMMIETDAPFLAPVPHRGKRNEPAFVTAVAQLIGEIKDMSLDEAGRQTATNAVAFFGLPS